MLNSESINQDSFQHPIVESASETEVVHIIGDVHLAGIEGVATAEIETVVSELGGEKESPYGKANGGTANLGGHGIAPDL